jgi:hypothetical protein
MIYASDIVEKEDNRTEWFSNFDRHANNNSKHKKRMGLEEEVKM